MKKKLSLLQMIALLKERGHRFNENNTNQICDLAFIEGYLYADLGFELIHALNKVKEE